MVGIILASHGKFAEGIKQSGSMIFGEQEDVQAVTLLPSDGPDDLKAKLQDAVASMSDPDEILILVDLWGGTPFNQSSGLFAGHEDKWAIVTGLNLPMLIEAYGSRLTMTSAQEIAKHLITAGKDGVKSLPSSLMPVEATAQPKTLSQGAIPEGTVLGDGHIKFVLSRIDSRLLHGQVATSWTKATKPSRIIVVSDGVAHDKLRKQLIEQACPPGVHANVIPLKKLVEITKDPRFGATEAMLLFENPEDLLAVVEAGVDIKEVNVGSMAHSKGKVVVNNVLSMGQEDVEAYEALKAKGIQFDVRKVPADSKGNMDELLEKAKKLLSEQK